MSDLKLGYGRIAGLPAGVEAAWGARLIWPNDLVPDRQDIVGSDEQRAQLAKWLNGGALRAALDLARSLDQTKTLLPSEDRQVTLYSDEVGTIVGSPQASHGYLYAAGWMFEHIPPMVHSFEDSRDAYDASQSLDHIRDGDVLKCADGVVGVLVKAWPVAVSDERGAFHRPTEGHALPRNYARSFELARKQIR